jgi:hypothetical protein
VAFPGPLAHSHVDLYRTIRDLLEERKRLDALIARLEGVRAAELRNQASPPANRRGRKAMTQEQRREVSERMKRYWEERRQAGRNPPLTAP